MNLSMSWHLSLPASLSQVQHVLGEQCACQWAGRWFLAFYTELLTFYIRSKVKSSALTGQTWTNLPSLSAPPKMESEQSLKGVIPSSLLPRWEVDTRVFQGTCGGLWKGCSPSEGNEAGETTVGLAHTTKTASWPNSPLKVTMTKIRAQGSKSGSQRYLRISDISRAWGEYTVFCRSRSILMLMTSQTAFTAVAKRKGRFLSLLLTL